MESAEETGRRVGRPRLRTEAIVEAALSIIDEDGADALSMRSLAQRLNSSTATIYRHFQSRAALVVAVIDRALGEIFDDVAEVASGDWRQVIRRTATGYFAALNRHPGVARLLADHTPVGPNAMVLREAWLSAMLRNGLSVEMAARTGGLMASYVQGFGIQLAGERARSGTDDEMLKKTVGELDPADYPSVSAVLRSGVAPTPLEEEFIFGLDLMLDGLAAVLENQRR
ncbi:MAG: TetR/AcrR family transcriptional regulator [Mycobacterium sp.]|nr:TetR/AcrR family transcriptional regulator [Mycobacterium sp.]